MDTSRKGNQKERNDRKGVNELGTVVGMVEKIYTYIIIFILKGGHFMYIHKREEIIVSSAALKLGLQYYKGLVLVIPFELYIPTSNF